MRTSWRSSWGTIVKIIFNKILSLVHSIRTIKPEVLTLGLVFLLYQIILHCCLAKIQIEFICQAFAVINMGGMSIQNLTDVVIYQTEPTNLYSQSLFSRFFITKFVLGSRIILRGFNFSEVIEPTFSAFPIRTLHVFGITK